MIICRGIFKKNNHDENVQSLQAGVFYSLIIQNWRNVPDFGHQNINIPTMSADPG